MSPRSRGLAAISLVMLVACGGADDKPDATMAKVDCPVADESGTIDIAPGLSARVIETGYGRAAVKGDYADTNVPCMLVGETRELVVAPELAYGAAGRGDAIPPNTPLIFTIELLKLASPE